MLKKGDEWDEVTRTLQTRVADEVTRAFVAVEQGERSIRAEAIELLAEEQLDLGATRTSARPFDVTALWRDKSLDGDEKGFKANFKTGLTGVRGAQGGVMMFGMMGSFLPGAAAVMIASNPVLLGAGALFGGMQIVEDRKRKVAQRRQSARQQVRQFIDDVQFEVTDKLTGLIRQAHRELRDSLTTRLTELQRTYTSAAQRAQADAKQTQEQLATRRAGLDQQLATLTRDRRDRRRRRCVMNENAHPTDPRGDGVAARTLDAGPQRRGARRRHPARGAGARDRRAAATARCGWPSPAGSRPASRRCSTPSSASGWRRPTPVSARG